MLPILFALIACGCGEQQKSPQPDQAGNSGFTSIFDGETLDGWEGDPVYWRVEAGNLVGEIIPETVLERNSFIIWTGGRPGDFELKLEYRITREGNSGINYRSERIDSLPYSLKGYQSDIDGLNRYTGQNYEEGKRTTLAYHGQKVIVRPLPDSLSSAPLRSHVSRNAWQEVEVTGSLGDPDSLNTFIKSEDWNECHLIVRGNRMQHFVNGILMSDVTDTDSLNRSMEGFIGVQVHVGPPMKVAFRNIRIKEF